MSARNAAIDRARTGLTVLVVIHHAVIPYTYYGYADAKRWLGFDGVILATDSFFMALFFLLSGLFVWPSLQRKSVASFLHDRLLRLGLPFAIAAVTLMPLAYYALEPRAGDMGFGAYWWKTVTVGPWPSGPVWFVWVLFAFDITAALLYRVAPHVLDAVNRLSARGFTNPVPFFIFFLVLTTAVYLPMRLYFGATHWFDFGGPFVVQTSRVLLYASYFFIGAGIGLAAMDKGLLSPDGQLARHWDRWALVTLVAYSCLVLLIVYKRGYAADTDNLPEWYEVAYGFALPFFSAAITFSFLAFYLHFDRPGTGFLDAMHESAYGIFLVHYVPILWMQYWLRDADLPAVAKATSLFVVALFASWAVTAALLRVPGARRVL
jgi:surface polysaccharide O-acyltransferase-like enzyme